MKQRLGWLAVIAIALLAFVGGALWQRNDVPPAVAGIEAGVAVDAGAVQVDDVARNDVVDVAQGVDDVAPATAAAATWPPLPAADRPLAEIHDELAERARRGDSGAACRLARELQTCIVAVAARELATNLQDMAALRDRTPERAVRMIATMEERFGNKAALCGGVTAEQIGHAFEWQLQAARARPDLRVAFALNPALDRRDFVDDLERWAEYRRVAMPWLETAAREGDAGALIALARIHGDLRRNSPPYPPFRHADAERALAYTDTLQRLGATYRGIDIGARTARAQLDADGIARATALADELLAAHAHTDVQAIDTAMPRTFESMPTPDECAAAP